MTFNDGEFRIYRPDGSLVPSADVSVIIRSAGAQVELLFVRWTEVANLEFVTPDGVRDFTSVMLESPGVQKSGRIAKFMSAESLFLKLTES